MEPRIRVNDILEAKVNDIMEAKDMADNGSVFTKYNDEELAKVNDIMEAKGMSDNGSVFTKYNDEELAKKYGISDDEVNAIRCMVGVPHYNVPKTSIAWSSYKPVIRNEFYEDMGYIVEDFAKLKAQIMSNNLSNEVMTILLENYEEKLQRFQKRYGNTEKL